LFRQLFSRIIHSTPPFRICFPPQSRLRIQSFEIEHGDSDLPHSSKSVLHNFLEHLLQSLVDHGIQKLWMLIPMTGPDFRKIIEPDR
jgi:hypothetical protein